MWKGKALGSLNPRLPKGFADAADHLLSQFLLFIRDSADFACDNAFLSETADVDATIHQSFTAASQQNDCYSMQRSIEQRGSERCVRRTVEKA